MVMKVKSKLWAALGSSKGHGRRNKSMLAEGSILSHIAAAVARCTSHHDVPVEDKYVHEILFLVSNAPVSVTFLSKRIAARLETTRDPAVALKTLVLLHRLLREGDRRFEQDVGNLLSSGELKMDLPWCSADVSHYHSFINSYSLFLEERMGWIINHAGMLEPVRSLQLESQSFEEEEAETVLYRLSKCQVFLDRAVDCLPHDTSWWSSQVMQSAFNIILRESFRVYDSFCDGMIIISSSSFELKKSLKDSALDILKEACIQTPKLHEFYEDCKRRNFGKILDYPSVRIVTKEQVSSMQDHLPTDSDYSPSKISKHTEIIGRTKEHENEVQETNVEKSEASRTLFFCKLETKISQVWVAFDEEDSQTSVNSVGDDRC